MPNINVVQTEVAPQYREMARALISPVNLPPVPQMGGNSYKQGEDAGKQAFGGFADAFDAYQKKKATQSAWGGMFGGQNQQVQPPLNIAPSQWGATSGDQAVQAAAAPQFDPSAFGQIQQFDPTEFNPASLFGLW
jgi:hypothetical protein